MDQLSPYFEPSDAEGADVSAAERRAELLLRTHGYAAYAAAQYNVLDRQRDVFPFWRYQTAQDDRVRDAHAALDGVVLPSDDPFWLTHFPPWDFNCRCTIVPLSPEDVEDIKADDEKKPPEERSVLTHDQIDRMNTSGTLVRGPSVNVDVRAPREKGRADGYAWQPGDLRLSLADIKARYEAPVWKTFETFARATTIDDGRTVYDWMDGQPVPTVPTSVPPASVVPSSVPPAAPAVAATPLPAKANQKPVSQALQIKAKGEVKKATVRALQLIDQTHDDGTLPQIPVVGHASKGANGTYWHSVPGKIGVPDRIGMSGKAPNKLMTMTHELGHFIDHQAIDVAGVFASQDSPLLEAWRNAVAKTTPIKALEALLQTAKNPKRITMLKYFLRGREIWARAYAQYIAIRTGDAEILAELAAIRGVPNYGEYVTWTDEEFAPIAKEIDQVFKGKGWIK